MALGAAAREFVERVTGQSSTATIKLLFHWERISDAEVGLREETTPAEFLMNRAEQYRYLETKVRNRASKEANLVHRIELQRLADTCASLAKHTEVDCDDPVWELLNESVNYRD